MIVRWLALLLVPYGTRAPARRAGHHPEPACCGRCCRPSGLTNRLPTSHFAGGVALAAAVSMAASSAATESAWGSSDGGTDALRSYLGDPDRG